MQGPRHDCGSLVEQATDVGGHLLKVGGVARQTRLDLAAVNLQQRHDAGTVDRGSRPSAGRVGSTISCTRRVGSGQLHNGSDRVGSRKE